MSRVAHLRWLDRKEGGWPELKIGFYEPTGGDPFASMERILRLVGEIERLDKRLEMVKACQLGKYFKDKQTMRRRLDELFAEARRWTLGS